ncbi:oxidoreductase [Paraburkholderia unamae]|uniref:Short-subunit dehydrogenase n=1 Tax=Paraburkholderia unamae TaxID=219649 RepID=A0ABX5KE98_9BURK|nr:oxidoreductase [Paraburkholderia unamae]PVX75685.1 short-subunit dehydrogenase [Paraburkholderia unamae]
MTGKVWMVTGASRGIGAAVVAAALEAGHRVVAAARHPGAIEAPPQHAQRLLAVPLDVTRSDDVHAALDAAYRRFGRIDVLVNNAGYGQVGCFENTSDAQVRAQFETNVFGAMNLTRGVLPAMRKQRGGHIFTVSSIAGFVSFSGSSIYSASKFALEGWMEGLSHELKPFGIHATLVEPGFFRTNFLDASSIGYGQFDIDDYAPFTAQLVERHRSMNHRQIGDPAKLAGALLGLAESASPPLRYAAGSDAVEFALAKIDSFRANIEAWRALSVSTDRDEREEALAQKRNV